MQTWLGVNFVEEYADFLYYQQLKSIVLKIDIYNNLLFDIFITHSQRSRGVKKSHFIYKTVEFFC